MLAMLKSCITRIMRGMLPITSDRLTSVYRYWLWYKRLPSLLRPKRFSEKVIRKRVRCNPKDEFLVLSADKSAVRKHVAETVGEKHLSQVYLVTNNPNEIDFDTLPYPCVLKSTHGSSQIKILRSRDSFDENEVRETCRQWLKTRFPLWYSYIPPQIMAEEFLSDKSKTDKVEEVPFDYKFFVFAGKVEMIVVDVDRFTDHKRSLFNADWEYLDLAYQFEKSGPLPKPQNFDAMLKIAESLSNNLDFVRVDLYDLTDRIVFGELTHSPTGGLYFDNFDLLIGKKWV